jgi:hypothetical protein
MKLSSEERKEKKREYNKRYRQNMTEEQKKRSREYNKSRYQNMTEEQKEKKKEYDKIMNQKKKQYPPPQLNLRDYSNINTPSNIKCIRIFNSQIIHSCR